MPRYFDKQLQRPKHHIYFLDEKYYFVDQDCFNRPIQEYQTPITIDQILEKEEKAKASNVMIVYLVLSAMPKFKTHNVDSYQMKHYMERYLKERIGRDQYITNEEGKLIMMAAGFSMTNKNKLNWRWNTSVPEINTVLFDKPSRITRGMFSPV